MEVIVKAPRNFLGVALLGLVLAACGGAAPAASATASSAPATSAPAATPSPAPSAAAGGWTVGAASKATVRVREQLVGVSAPSDAVLEATGAKGSFQLNADGTFAAGSKISFDLTTLTSDQRLRDNFIKSDTLQTRQFPTAELVPAKTSGLAVPLAPSGTFTFQLTGNMTIHGTTKEVTFDVRAMREGGTLTATATASPSFTFGDFGMRAPSVASRVVSVVDEIRLTVELVATIV